MYIDTYAIDGGLGTTGEMVKAEVDKLSDMLFALLEPPFLSFSSRTTLKNWDGKRLTSMLRAYQFNINLKQSSQMKYEIFSHEYSKNEILKTADTYWECSRFLFLDTKSRKRWFQTRLKCESFFIVLTRKRNEWGKFSKYNSLLFHYHDVQTIRSMFNFLKKII